jgi:3'-phosphoadenosine 5'-phosphosulfate sulfotransferase (PAPS reductase)/FAD synthetase
LISISCNKKEAYLHYEKPVPEKTDATFSWLMEPRNEENPNYMGVFYKYYNQLIKANKLENASSILNVVCLKKCRKYSFEPDFVSTVTTFAIKYRIKLPVNKTLYINSFFTDLYKDKGDYKTAISYALKTTKVEVTNYTTCLEKAKAYSDLAFCYFSVGNQNAAISYNIKALELNNQIDNFSGLGRGYNTLATIYFSSNDFTQAIIYYDKAIKYLKKVNDLENVFIILENKIIAYEESENPNINTLVDSVYTAFNKSKIPSDDIRIFVYSCYITKLIRENKLKEAKKTIDYLAPFVKKTNRIVTDIEFDEVNEFADTQYLKFFDKKIIDLEGGFKESLEECVNNYNMKTIFMGCRDVDFKENDKHQNIEITDEGWPSIIRIYPILDWTHEEVWLYHKMYKLDYCNLYDEGYTSLGDKTKTIKNKGFQQFQQPNNSIIFFFCFLKNLKRKSI